VRNVKKKLVFFDIDGTLLDHDKKLPKSTKEAIFSLKDKGINVAIATGRAPFMYENLRDELGINTFVSFNGQYVVFEGNVLYTNPLNPERLDELRKFALKKKHPLVYMNAEYMRSNVENHPFIHKSISSLKFEHPNFEPDFLTNREIYQTLLFCVKEEEEQYIQTFSSFQFIRWHQFSTDIIPYGGSKAEGIKKIMEVLEVDRKDVYAFGDGLNDAEMLDFVGTGVAMGNAEDSIKQRADVITKSVDENGIAHGLELIGLLK
jgi:Cof subfamily protein (haloacid dehalogenase superfamily)